MPGFVGIVVERTGALELFKTAKPYCVASCEFGAGWSGDGTETREIEVARSAMAATLRDIDKPGAYMAAILSRSSAEARASSLLGPVRMPSPPE